MKRGSDDTILQTKAMVWNFCLFSILQRPMTTRNDITLETRIMLVIQPLVVFPVRFRPLFAAFFGGRRGGTESRPFVVAATASFPSFHSHVQVWHCGVFLFQVQQPLTCLGYKLPNI